MEKDLAKVIFTRKLLFKEEMKSIKQKLKVRYEMVRKLLRGIKHMKIEQKMYKKEDMKDSLITKAGRKCLITKQVVLKITIEICMRETKTNLIKLGIKQHKKMV